MSAPSVKREREPGAVEEAAGFFFLVDGIERVEEGFDAGIGTPQRGEQADGEAEAECLGRCGGERVDLVVDDLHAAIGHNAVHGGELLADGGGVRDHAVERNQRGDGGEDGEQRVIGGPRLPRP